MLAKPHSVQQRQPGAVVASHPLLRHTQRQLLQRPTSCVGVNGAAAQACGGELPGTCVAPGACDASGSASSSSSSPPAPLGAVEPERLAAGAECGGSQHTESRSRSSRAL